MLWLIAITLLFPLFIQFNGGIYNNVVNVTDSGGLLDRLPLPISIGACVFGMIVFFRNYRQASLAMIFISALAAAILLSLIFATESFDIERRKLIIAAQFLLPTMALVFGQMVSDEKGIIPRAFMWVLVLLVPLQLLLGWWQQKWMLTYHLYVFSIYQHFQFVPAVFVVAFCLVIVSLWDEHKALLRFLTISMSVYVIASASTLAIGLYSGFIALFFLWRMYRLKTKTLIDLLVLGGGAIIIFVTMSLYYDCAKSRSCIDEQYVGKFQALVKSTQSAGEFLEFSEGKALEFSEGKALELSEGKALVKGDGWDSQYALKFQLASEGKMPANLAERLVDWKMYSKGIIESDRTLVFGHAKPLPREVRTSPHNWYIDLVYNFGLIALLPVIALMGFTMQQVWCFRKTLPAETWWLVGLVAFMVLVDSNLKVTLRQPYPGIFAYFLWGFLLTRLRFRPVSRQGT